MEKEGTRSRARIGVGSIISRSFGIWLRNIVPFSLVIGIVFLPLVVYAVQFHTTAPEARTEDQQEMFDVVLEYGPRALILLVTGALVYGVFEQLAGRRPGFAACLGVGLSRLIPVILVGLTVGIVWNLPMVILSAMAPLLGLVGAIISLVLLCTFFVAVPAAVVERPGIFGAMGRSAELTRGHRGTIFLVNLVIGILQWAAVVGFVFLLAESESSLTWMILGANVLFGGLMATVSVVVYHDLRHVKEGIGVEELQKVFA